MLSADVSWNVIGGQYSLQVELIAQDSSGNQCNQMIALGREAPDNPAPLITATPTCRQDPAASYC